MKDLNVTESLDNPRIKEIIFKKITLPLFITSFKNIKRDFCGLPIMISWQAIHEGERKIYNNEVGNIKKVLNNSLFFSAVSKKGFNLNKSIPFKIKFLILTKSSEKPKKSEILKNGESLSKPSKAIQFTSLKSNVDNIKDIIVYYLVEKENFESPIYEFKVVDTNSSEKYDIYQQFYKDIYKSLNKYVNEYWYFFNTDKTLNKIYFKDIKNMKPNSISIHLDDIGHELLASSLHENLKEIINNLSSFENIPRCNYK